ncbi:uncharacterized protein IL334_007170 [Kwoniella shivajii]|uniref:Uncharacterized protein n=1 Tax=Kwoniella shivajii TaxID=564305 RepID=A0ABZ1DB31_9TREE|nr:hypothetical protein IL334_007170 [Kwoniella shivajii]
MRAMAPINDIVEYCPALEHLHISAYEPNHFDLAGPFWLYAHTESMTNPTWSFTLRYGQQMNDFSDSGPLSEWPKSHFLDQFLDAFAHLNKIVSLDCTVTLVLPDEVDNTVKVDRRSTKRVYDIKRADQAIKFSNGGHPSDLRYSAMTAAAQLFIDRIPSLEQGHLWQDLSSDGTYSFDCVLRWT